MATRRPPALRAVDGRGLGDNAPIFVIDLCGDDDDDIDAEQMSSAVLQGQASAEGTVRGHEGRGATTLQGPGSASAPGVGGTAVAREGADRVLVCLDGEEGGNSAQLPTSASGSGANVGARHDKFAPSQLVDIAALGPDHERWKIRGECTFKGELRKYKRPESTVLVISFLLTDATGSIRCHANSYTAAKVDEVVERGGAYEVSNSQLTFAEKGSAKYELLLGETSCMLRFEGEYVEAPWKPVLGGMDGQSATIVRVEEKLEARGLVPALTERQEAATSGKSGPKSTGQTSCGEVVVNSHPQNSPSSNHLESARESSRPAAQSDAGALSSDPTVTVLAKRKMQDAHENNLPTPHAAADGNAGFFADGDRCRSSEHPTEVNRHGTPPEMDNSSRAAICVANKDLQLDTVDDAENGMADSTAGNNFEPPSVMEKQIADGQIRTADENGFDGIRCEAIRRDAMVITEAGTMSDSSSPNDNNVLSSRPAALAATDALVDGSIFMGLIKLLADNRCECPCCGYSFTRLSFSRHMPCKGNKQPLTSELREAANALSHLYYPPRRKKPMPGKKKRGVAHGATATKHGFEISPTGRVKCPTYEDYPADISLSDLDHPENHCRLHPLPANLREGVTSVLMHPYVRSGFPDASAGTEKPPIQISNDRSSCDFAGAVNNPLPGNSITDEHGNDGRVGGNESAVEVLNNTCTTGQPDDLPESQVGRESLKRKRDKNTPAPISDKSDLPERHIRCPECTFIVDQHDYERHCQLFHDIPATEEQQLGSSGHGREESAEPSGKADAGEDSMLEQIQAEDRQKKTQIVPLKNSVRFEMRTGVGSPAHAAVSKLPPVSLQTQEMMITCGLKLDASGEFECPAPHCDALLRVQSLCSHSRSYCKTFEMMEDSLRVHVNELIESVAKDRSKYRHSQNKQRARTHVGDSSSSDDEESSRRAQQGWLSRARAEKGRSRQIAANSVAQNQLEPFSSKGPESPQLSTGSASSASELESCHPSLLVLEPRLLVCPICKHPVLARRFPKLLESGEHEKCKQDILKESGLYEAILLEARKYEDLRASLSKSLAEKERSDPTLAQAYDIFRGRTASRSPPCQRHDGDSGVAPFRTDRDQCENPESTDAPQILAGTRNIAEASATALSSRIPALVAVSPSGNKSGTKASRSPLDVCRVVGLETRAGKVVPLERAAVSQVVASEHARPEAKRTVGEAFIKGAMPAEGTGIAMKKQYWNSFASEKDQSGRNSSYDIVVCPAPRCRKTVPLEGFGSHLYSDNCQAKDSLTNEEFIATERALTDSYNLRFLGTPSDFF